MSVLIIPGAERVCAAQAKLRQQKWILRQRAVGVVWKTVMRTAQQNGGWDKNISNPCSDDQERAKQKYYRINLSLQNPTECSASIRLVWMWKNNTRHCCLVTPRKQSCTSVWTRSRTGWYFFHTVKTSLKTKCIHYSVDGFQFNSAARPYWQAPV